MSVLTRIAAALVAALLLPAAAFAQSFSISYTTFNDGVNPSVSAAFTVTTDGGAFYGPGNYLITGVTSGTRNGVGITGVSDEFSSFYYPAQQPFGYGFTTYVDSFGFTYTAGGVDYQVYRDPGDTSFYHEYSSIGGVGQVGRLIALNTISITPLAVTGGVPEPATWALMLAGFAAAGAGMRRRRATHVLA